LGRIELDTAVSNAESGMFDDTKGHRILLISVNSSGALQIWAWTGTDWSQLSERPPSRAEGVSFDWESSARIELNAVALVSGLGLGDHRRISPARPHCSVGGEGYRWVTGWHPWPFDSS
jgi:hypothetical protein